MTKWLPIAVTVLITLGTAVFTPAFLAAHPYVYAGLNAGAQVLHSVLPSTVQ